jgi:hypothetical protein
MLIWIDKRTGTWGETLGDIVTVDIPGSLMGILEAMTASEVIALANEAGEQLP